MSASADVESPRLRLSDLARIASVGLRTRPMRAALSALGIAIGVAAIVAVLGLSSSSQAGLLAQIDKLGTNLLTVQNGETLFGEAAELPLAAPGMISRIGPVQQVQYPVRQHERAHGAGGKPRPAGHRRSHGGRR
jgi:putative ABC transport system permease protein